MSDEMPKIAYLGKQVICSPDSGFSGSYYTKPSFIGRELTPYISQASSNQAVRDALDKAATELCKTGLLSKGGAWMDIINNLKSKYEGE